MSKNIKNDNNYDELINEIKTIINKLNSNEIQMNQAIELFEQGLSDINFAKQKLEEYKGQINKVLEDNKIEEFEK